MELSHWRQSVLFCYRPGDMQKQELTEAAIRALHSSAVFSLLPEASIEKLAQFAKFEKFRQPTLIVAAGEPTKVLRYVLKGYIAARAYASDSMETELIPIQTGGFSVWIGTFTSAPIVQDYWTSADTELISFPNEKILEEADKYPLVYKQALEQIAHRFQLVLKWVWNSSQMDRHKRLAQHLLLYSSLKEVEDVIRIKVAQETLAKSLGCSRQTLNRQLRVLECNGLLEIGYREIIIRDRDALENFCKEPMNTDLEP